MIFSYKHLWGKFPGKISGENFRGKFPGKISGENFRGKFLGKILIYREKYKRKFMVKFPIWMDLENGEN